jgi:hypothetical protein
MMRHIANWFRRKKLESGLDRELRYHLERRIIDLEKTGVPTSAARRQALMELGGIEQVQEQVRDSARWSIQQLPCFQCQPLTQTRVLTHTRTR